MKPIGVFDSGLGGLTVVREFIRRQPGAPVIYLGDTARVPYGTKSAQTVLRFAKEDIHFLRSLDVAGVVAACNTASSLALPFISSREDSPLLGVIDPGVERALEVTTNGKIGVIGTPSTIASKAYECALKERDSAVAVFSRSCPLFVPLVEEGWLDDPATRMIAHRYLDVFHDEGIDTLILGCTHYPLLYDLLAEIMGDGVTLVSSAESVACRMVSLWGSQPEIPANNDALDVSSCRFFVTDEPVRFKQIAEKFLGAAIDAMECVQLEEYSECWGLHG